MDQIYLPRNREGLNAGDYVVVEALEEEIGREKKNGKVNERLFFYGVKDLEPIKLEIIKKVMKILMDKRAFIYNNIIITGSFLNKGFNFKDIDLIIVGDKINGKYLKGILEEKTGIEFHINGIKNKDLIAGLESDPLYEMMLNKCISKKRFVYRTKRKIDYKILDLHLLKSKALIDNFDILNGGEKYYLVRNAMAIYLFIKGKKISKESVDTEVKKIFGVNIDKIKDNLLDRDDFIRKYNSFYDKVFDLIIRGGRK